jgi:hypothetical protein
MLINKRVLAQAQQKMLMLRKAVANKVKPVGPRRYQKFRTKKKLLLYKIAGRN